MGVLSHFTLEGVGRSKKQHVFFVDAIYLWKRTNSLRVTGVDFSCLFILTLMTWRLPISPNRWPSQAPCVFSHPVASGRESEVPVWAIRRSEKIAFQMLHFRLLPWAPRVLPWTPHPWRRGRSQDDKSYQHNQTHVVLMFEIGDRNKSSSSSSPPPPSSSSSLHIYRECVYIYTHIIVLLVLFTCFFITIIIIIAWTSRFLFGSCNPCCFNAGVSPQEAPRFHGDRPRSRRSLTRFVACRQVGGLNIKHGRNDQNRNILIMLSKIW